MNLYVRCIYLVHRVRTNNMRVFDARFASVCVCVTAFVTMFRHINLYTDISFEIVWNNLLSLFFRSDVFTDECTFRSILCSNHFVSFNPCTDTSTRKIRYSQCNSEKSTLQSRRIFLTLTIYVSSHTKSLCHRIIRQLGILKYTQKEVKEMCTPFVSVCVCARS